ncbi:hypothetical protein ACJX0J_011317, partial [Zea mays]
QNQLTISDVARKAFLHSVCDSSLYTCSSLTSTRSKTRKLRSGACGHPAVDQAPPLLFLPDDDDVSPDASPSLAHLGIDPRISTPTPTSPRCRTSPDLPPWTSMTYHPMSPCLWRTQAMRAPAPTLGTICPLMWGCTGSNSNQLCWLSGEEDIKMSSLIGLECLHQTLTTVAKGISIKRIDELKFLCEPEGAYPTKECTNKAVQGDQCDNCRHMLNPTELIDPKCKQTSTRDPWLVLDTEIAMGAYQPHYAWSTKNGHPDGQAHTMEMMYTIIADEFKSMDNKDMRPEDYLNFFCLGNREEPPSNGSPESEKSTDKRSEVFSAFGYVHKIVTFEKAAGFQALIQYTDAATASDVRESLDGRSIPSYLLPEHCKFAHVTFIKPEYLQDSDIVMNRFHKQRHVYEGWEQHLGLEHTTTAPKRSYLGNNQ